MTIALIVPKERGLVVLAPETGLNAGAYLDRMVFVAPKIQLIKERYMDQSALRPLDAARETICAPSQDNLYSLSGRLSSPPTEGEVRDLVEKWMSTFPMAVHRAAVRRMLEPLSPHGKAGVTALLASALAIDKLSLAFVIIEKLYETRWQHQPALHRGDPRFLDNMQSYRQAYARLGLPMPEGAPRPKEAPHSSE